MEKSFDFGRLLKNHEKKHKSKPSQFASVASGVKKRLETNIKNRKSCRLTVFDSLRNISRCESPVKVPNVLNKVEHRRQQLELWKKEKDKQKREAAAQKKKPFIAGVAHNPLKFVPPPPPKPMPSTSGRVTRSTTNKNNKQTATAPTQNSFAPKNAPFRPPEIKNMTKLPSLAPPKKNAKKHNITFDPVVPTKNETRQTRSRSAKTAAIESKPVKASEKNVKTRGKTKASPKKLPKLLQSSTSSSSEMEQTVSPVLMPRSRKSLPAPSSPAVVKKTPRKSLNSGSRNVTPNKPVPKSESSSEERLRSPKSLTSSSDMPMTPEQVAEEVKKISPCVTMSRGKANARKEMKKKIDEGLLDEDASDMDSVDYFRKQLASEIKRMTEMCETWDKISEQTVLPEMVQEAVLAAVGQARLLMSKKMQQFAALIESCAKPMPGHSLVTPADLHGFWDMVFMQVENVDMRFKKLEDLRARGWVEQVVEQKKKVIKQAPAKKTTKSAVPSRLRDMIAAARKAKKDQEVPSEPAPEENKTFEAGFFSVRSPVRSPAVRTPNKGNLLKAVLSSEAKKASASKNSASFAMLRASVLSKNYDCDGVAPIPQTPINLHATPGRSILKSTTKDPTGRKSIKVVLFDNSDAEVKDNDQSLTPQTKDKHTDNIDTESDVPVDSENKENSTRKSRLVRQDAEDSSPVATRSRRKSVPAQEPLTPRRSARKKVLQQPEDELEEKPTRSSRRRKSGLQVQN